MAVAQAIWMVLTSQFPTCVSQGQLFKDQNHNSVLVRSHRLHPLQLQVHLLVVGSLALVASVAIHMQILHRFALTVSSVKIAELMHASVRAQDQPHHQVLALVATAAGPLEVLSVEQAMAAFVGVYAAAIAVGLQVDHSVEQMMEVSAGLLAVDRTWSFQLT